MTPFHRAAISHRSVLRRGAVLILLAAVLAGVMFGAIQRGRPVDLPDAMGAMLPCISYAPFRRSGETPFDSALRITPAVIEADLRLLATVTGCVRTYGLDHGLDAVPAVARRLGLKVVLGAWIGRDATANAAQLQRALALANEYRDVVQLLVVGNEVLLRQELPPEELATLLAQAHQESLVPVSYADVWAFWLRHAAILQPHVDVVAAHILPYWEDEPVGIEQAADYVYSMAAQLRQAFGPTPIFIAETGWPAAGRQRGPAAPGRTEQARFVRELLARQASVPLAFNLIEGFDQPWKRALEGAMGGAWGLFDADGVLRVPLAGPIIPDPDWAWLPAAALLGAVLLAGTEWAIRRRLGGFTSMLALLLGGALVGVFSVQQALALPVWSRNLWEWTSGSLALLTSALCGGAATWRLAHLMQGTEVTRMDILGTLARRGSGTRWLALMQFGVLCLAVIDALWLVFDARYRALPWQGIAAPALLLLALAILGDRLPASARAERLLAVAAIICATLIVFFEGSANGSALLYAGALLLLALASL
jgi:glucan 1,3-beta-glucosidase